MNNFLLLLIHHLLLNHSWKNLKMIQKLYDSINSSLLVLFTYFFIKVITSPFSIKTIDKPIYLNSNNISISEINFHVFQIPSNDYFLELYEHLMKKYMNKNNITEISFFDFDKKYLRTKDSELIQYDISSSDNDGKQTSLSRFRHLIAHGGNIGTEKGYINYRNNVFNPSSTTKYFYN